MNDCAFPLSVPELRGQIRRLPRVSLCQLPTPLEYCGRLSKKLGVNLYLKRDDCTGLGMGGNKVRQLEFTMADAIQSGADCIVQGAAAQSNHCRQAAAAAARLGLDCTLVLCRDAHAEEGQGNLLLDELFGAKVEFVETDMGGGIQSAKKAAAERLKAQGRKPYVIGPPKALALGAAAFAEAFTELMAQAAQQQLGPQHLFVCSCGATGGGLLLANKCLGTGLKITCASPVLWEWPTAERLCQAANLCAETLNLPVRLSPPEIHYTDNFVPPGYGIPSKAGCEALRLLAQTEGVVLDPIYTAKAFAALLAAVESKEVQPGSEVIFWHTGGIPAIFAYKGRI